MAKLCLVTQFRWLSFHPKSNRKLVCEIKLRNCQILRGKCLSGKKGKREGRNGQSLISTPRRHSGSEEIQFTTDLSQNMYGINIRHTREKRVAISSQSRLHHHQVSLRPLLHQFVCCQPRHYDPNSKRARKGFGRFACGVSRHNLRNLSSLFIKKKKKKWRRKKKKVQNREVRLGNNCACPQGRVSVCNVGRYSFHFPHI